MISMVLYFSIIILRLHVECEKDTGLNNLNTCICGRVTVFCGSNELQSVFQQWDLRTFKLH